MQSSHSIAKGPGIVILDKVFRNARLPVSHLVVGFCKSSSVISQYGWLKYKDPGDINTSHAHDTAYFGSGSCPGCRPVEGSTLREVSGYNRSNRSIKGNASGVVFIRGALTGWSQTKVEILASWSRDHRRCTSLKRQFCPLTEIKNALLNIGRGWFGVE